MATVDEKIAKMVRQIRAQERELQEAAIGFDRTARRHEEAMRPLKHQLSLSKLALEELLEPEDADRHTVGLVPPRNT